MNIVIIGATSAIAQGAARRFAALDKASFLLAGREASRLETVAADLRARGAAAATVWAGDLTDEASPRAVLDRAAALGPIDLVLIAHGSLSDENRAATEPDYRRRELAVNLHSPMAFAYAAAETFRRGGKGGQIALITSVAGERGRAKNFFYGSCKSALIAFSQGLRANLLHERITVTELRPGFIDTPMTAGLRKGLLFTSAEKAGEECYQAIKARRLIAYIPGYWAFIMAIIRLIPERVFQRLRF